MKEHIEKPEAFNMSKYNPYQIISDKKESNAFERKDNQRVAVFVSLYYEERIEKYKKYIEAIPESIDVFIVSSKDEVLKHFETERYHTIKKENRGRDITALLIAARTEIFKYEYICFIHDKKEKSEYSKDYTELWEKNLWENMLGTEHYIYNVIQYLNEKKTVGMLAPLPPHKGDLGIWLAEGWGENFENVKKLAKELQLNVSLSQDIEPIAFSTVFWAKTKALKKLYAKEWKYTDFPEEPLKNDGQLNHAVERIIQYVVEDAGYETRIVISSSYAEGFVQQMHDELSYLWEFLKREYQICSYKSMEEIPKHLKVLNQFAFQHKQFFLYGAGIKCKKTLFYFDKLGITPSAILVSDTSNNPSELDGIPVISIDEFQNTPDSGIIVTVGKKYQPEVIRELEKRGITDYMLY